MLSNFPFEYREIDREPHRSGGLRGRNQRRVMATEQARGGRMLPGWTSPASPMEGSCAFATRTRVRLSLGGKADEKGPCL